MDARACSRGTGGLNAMTMLLAALALTLQAAPAAVAPAVHTAVDAVRKARGLELARMLNSEELTRAQTEKLLDETLPKLLAADPDFKAMEKEYPGITKAMLDAMRTVVVDEVMQSLPALWDSVSVIYAEELTAADLGEAIAFFRTPAGTRLIENITREADLSEMLKTLIADDEAKVTESALRTEMRASATKTVGKLNTEDRNALVNFGWSPAGVKIRTANKRVMSVVAAWSNETTPEGDARMEKTMTDVVEKFIGKDATQ
jgi:hypothetical protein